MSVVQQKNIQNDTLGPPSAQSLSESPRKNFPSTPRIQESPPTGHNFFEIQSFKFNAKAETNCGMGQHT